MIQNTALINCRLSSAIPPQVPFLPGRWGSNFSQTSSEMSCRLWTGFDMATSLVLFAKRSMPENQTLDNLVTTPPNLGSGKIIENVPIKNQCSRDYFYGNNERLESGIQIIERSYADILRSLTSQHKFFTNKQKLALLRFWLFQYLRTEAASSRSVESISNIESYTGLDPGAFNMRLKDAVNIAMQLYGQNLTLIDDLQVVLLVNYTQIPFISSDDPSIRTNRWHLYNNKDGPPGFGLKSSGLLCFLPMTPNICMLAFDKDVYSIQRKSAFVNIKKSTDIDTINQFQYFNCLSNIYFHNINSSEYIQELDLQYKKNRPITRQQTNYAVQVEASRGSKCYMTIDPKEAPKHQHALIYSYEIYPQPQRWPTFLHWRKKGFTYSKETSQIHFRRAHINRYFELPFNKLKTGY